MDDKIVLPLPNYQNLDNCGEAQQAAVRMEARSREPASEEMFQLLVAPLLTANVKTTESSIT